MRLPRVLALAAPLALLGLLAADSPADPQQKKAKPPAKPQTATPAETLKVAKGFHVELLYSVPKDKLGSWVNMCADPKGRLIVSDQYGPMYRLTPPAVGTMGETKIEEIPAKIGDAQGLLWAFDSLYVVVNSGRIKSGLYRVTSSKNDDTLDKVELLQEIGGGGGEHGPHAVLMNPDGKRLTVVCGNQSKLVKAADSKPVPVWGEDHLLPRMPDGRGFMAGVNGPGGAIYNVTPDGKTWEIFAVGFRNEFDAAYNRAGDLFTYDADMEWDFNTPWYRPTRVCQVTSGAEFGWRNGAGKYPAYYADSLPAVCDIGPGSPTGVAFGYGAKFPAKFQNALFICDWSYGKMYAVHTTPAGGACSAVAEEFVAGTPLPLTDVIVNPIDGAMYFTIGGRKTQSGLYRVTYTGPESTAPDTTIPAAPAKTLARKELEKFHTAPNPAAVAAAWPMLADDDRFVRFAARVAIEHQPSSEWAAKALAETNPTAAITALLALARVSAQCPAHRKPTDPDGDPALRAKILAALNAIPFASLDEQRKLELIRVYQVLFNRFGRPTADERAAVLAKFEPAFPTGVRFVDGELCQVMVYLQSDQAAAKTVKLLDAAPTQEEQIEYARALRELAAGWTPDLRKSYFTWIAKAEGFTGGNSFGGFITQIKAAAVAKLSAEEKTALKSVLELKAAAAAATYPPRPLVKQYKMDDLAVGLEKGLAGGRDFARGKKLFGEAKCAACHRYGPEGGMTGPDLTQAGGRFAPRDLLESIIDPSKEVSDQYAAVDVEMGDGRKVSGRVVNLNGDGIILNTDMMNPNALTTVNRSNIESMKTSKLSMMPVGTLDVLKEDEVLDLLAFLLSRGDKGHKMFAK